MATIVKDLGAVTAYAYAKEKGYTGTEDEFAELMASYADVAEQAAESAAQAGASATAAEQAKAEAVLSASAAASSASTASTKASEAASSASSAAGSANTATTKANEASTSATNAASSASAAATSATNAGASETAAASSATAASNAQTAAETAQGKAEDAQTAAEDAAASVSASAAQITQNTEDVADLKSNIREFAEVTGDNTGIETTFVTVKNGTWANSGNANCVNTGEIAVSYGDIIRIKTDRPIADGKTYRSQITLLRSDKTYYNSFSWVDGFPPYVIINSPVAYVCFDIASTEGALRKASFDGYSVIAEAQKANNIVDGIKAEDNVIPVMRNGSVGNAGNANKIAMLSAVSVNSARSMQLEYLDEVADGYTLTWNISFYDNNGGIVRNIDRTGKIVNLTSYLRSFQSIETITCDLSLSDQSATVIPLRVETLGNCVKVVNFNDKYLQEMYDLMNPAINREVFAFVSGAGKVIFKDRPVFSASGRCAWKLENSIGFKVGNSAITYIAFDNILNACGDTDTVTVNGVKWVYLRTNKGILYNASTSTVSVVDLTEATRLTGNEYILIGTWSGNFVCGLLLQKFIEDIYAPPLSTFNSSNILFDIDVGEKANEFANCIGSSTETDAFLFFTDPHTYKKNMDMNEAEYLQTVVQKYFNSIPADFVICGGDWLTDSDTPQLAKYKLGLESQSMGAMVKPYYQMVGNHDTNSQGTQSLTVGEVNNVMFREYEHNYFRFETKNTAFYIFDSWNDGTQNMGAYQWEQLTWFAESLQEENKEHIAIGIHIWLDQGTTRPMVNNLIDLITAYNSKTEIEQNSVIYDYTSATGRIEFVIAGHTHADSNLVIDNSVPVIITRNAMQSGVANFDLCFVDYTERRLYCIRVGNGENRTFNLDTGEIVS